MANIKQFIINVAICFVLPQLLLGGCSLIGFKLGESSDSSSKRGEAISIITLREMRIGTSLAVVMADARQIEGDYLGIKEEDAVAYEALYMAAVRDLQVEGCLPFPGDSVTFTTRETPWLKARGKFRGVDPGTMVVNQSGRRVSVSDLGALKADSCADVDLSAFSALVRNRNLPLITKSVLLEVGGDTTVLSAADIVRGEVRGAPVGKFIGLGIGAVLDAIAIVVLANSEQESRSKGSAFACSKTLP